MRGGVVEEVRRLDVAVDHTIVGEVIYCFEQRVHVAPDVIDVKRRQVREEGLALLVLEHERHLALETVATDQVSHVVLPTIVILRLPRLT